MRENGWCVWITGLPGSGKSVVSKMLLKLLHERGVSAQILSSDALRKIMTPEPTYSIEERDNVYSTLAYIAKLLTENHVNVIIDATGNLRRYRERAREQIPAFMEVYLQCPLNVCVQREANRDETYHAPKHIYARATKGETSTVPGIGQPYQPPLHPGITLDTVKLKPEESANKIVKKLLMQAM